MILNGLNDFNDLPAMYFVGNSLVVFLMSLQKSDAGVQKSDAGVGIGTLIGDRDYLSRK